MRVANIQTQIRMPRGKFNGINALANEKGIIAALAMDQRGSLQKTMTKLKGTEATDADLIEFKTLVSEVLTPYASAILLDPEYGLEAAKHRAKNVGLLLAYEKTGYGQNVKGRLPDLLPDWSALRLENAGANAVKVLMYYDPDDRMEINTIKHAFIERVGAECYANDIPFFLELLAYSDQIGDEKSFAFARAKPMKVRKYMQEFSRPLYRIDVLKVEIPVNMRYVEGARANGDGQVAYSREEAKQYFYATAEATKLPFIYLSGGVTNPVFIEELELVAECNVPFSGVLCGRATWQEGIKEYVHGGPQGFRNWLKNQGVRNIEAVNQVLSKGAKAWWDFYGGKDRIQVIDIPTVADKKY